MKQLFRYAAGRHETAADRVIIERAYEDFRDSGFHFQELMVSLSKWMSISAGRQQDGSSSSLKIALFRAASFSVGLPRHDPRLVGLPPLVAMFNSNGTAYAAEPNIRATHAIRSLVQRQRHSREVLDSRARPAPTSH